MTDTERIDWSICHCGSNADGYLPGYCAHCSRVRCDAFPGECVRREAERIYADAEVKSMCETAGEFGVRIGRKAALEEAEAAVIAVRDARMPLSEVLQASTYGQLDKAAKAVRDLTGDLCGCILGQEHARADHANLSLRVPGAVPNGLTAPRMHPDTPEDTKPPQEGVADLVGRLRESVDAARKRRIAERDCPGCGQNGTGLENHRSDCVRNPRYLPEESDQ